MKHLMLWMLILSLTLAGCGNKVDSTSKDVSVSKANALLDSGNVEGAILVLGPPQQGNPSDSGASNKLLHAYAGAGSFRQ